jgi:hypothetical protein
MLTSIQAHSGNAQANAAQDSRERDQSAAWSLRRGDVMKGKRWRIDESSNADTIVSDNTLFTADQNASSSEASPALPHHRSGARKSARDRAVMQRVRGKNDW